MLSTVEKRSSVGLTLRCKTRELSDLPGRPVDLIPEHELNRYLGDAILEEAIEL